MAEWSFARYDDKPMRMVVRKSSRDRLWTGFDATLYDAFGGYIETPPFAKHNISMLVGVPLRTACRCDGAVSRRLQIPGDIDIIPAGFSGAWVDEGSSSFLIVNVSRSLVRMAAEEMGLNPERISIAPQLSLRDPQIAHVMWALKAELETPAPIGRLYAESLGMALAAQLLRRYAPAVSRRAAGGLSKPRLQRVTDYIRGHLTQDLALAELAEIANVSPSHFKALFKQAVGLPVHQYVIRSRVDFAIDLLRDGKLPLSDVALQAGFANQSHMARCMRRVAGVTPGAVRDAL
jgi:AraC family transcriptional regulator